MITNENTTSEELSDEEIREGLEAFVRVIKGLKSESKTSTTSENEPSTQTLNG